MAVYAMPGKGIFATSRELKRTPMSEESRKRKEFLETHEVIAVRDPQTNEIVGFTTREK